MSGLLETYNERKVKNKKEGLIHIMTHNEEKIEKIKEKFKKENGRKLGRNDLCPCGSGKKFKKCCGKAI